jgi:transposase
MSAPSPPSYAMAAAPRYPSDVDDPTWAIVASLLARPTARGRPRVHADRLSYDAIVDVARGGIAWRMLPRSFPAWQTVYTVAHLPYRSGRSRQSAPVPRRQRIPLMICRWSRLGLPTLGFTGGRSACRRSHWASVSSCRLIPVGYGVSNLLQTGPSRLGSPGPSSGVRRDGRHRRTVPSPPSQLDVARKDLQDRPGPAPHCDGVIPNLDL